VQLFYPFKQFLPQVAILDRSPSCRTPAILTPRPDIPGAAFDDIGRVDRENNAFPTLAVPSTKMQSADYGPQLCTVASLLLSDPGWSLQFKSEFDVVSSSMGRGPEDECIVSFGISSSVVEAGNVGVE
jgi:hypothetical protein